MIPDRDRGKRMVEEMMLDAALDSLRMITGRAETDEGTDGFPYVEGSPDFIVGLDGRPLGIELAEVRGKTDAEMYFEEVTAIAWKKNESYKRRGLFKNQIALILYGREPPLFDIRHSLAGFAEDEVFDDLGFVEMWAADLSDAYFNPGHPLRPADMFCMKPRKWLGFHRIGAPDRKPFG